MCNAIMSSLDAERIRAPWMSGSAVTSSPLTDIVSRTEGKELFRSSDSVEPACLVKGT